jgi:hypothetical protein
MVYQAKKLYLVTISVSILLSIILWTAGTSPARTQSGGMDGMLFPAEASGGADSPAEAQPLAAAYIEGLTESTDFPTTENAFQPTLRGPEDLLVTKVGSTAGDTRPTFTPGSF